MAPDFLEVDNLTKTFPATSGIVPWVRTFGRVERRPALEGVSFRVCRGELFGILGANGAGKSTILRIIAGLVVPDGGTIRVGGADARTHPLELRRKVGLCSTDDRSFYFRLSARLNLEYFGTLAGLFGKGLRSRIAEVARAVDLVDHLDRRFDAFSTGMKQRLGIARALLADPELLVLDEPTRAVDPAHAASIRAFVRDDLVKKQGKTVLLATNVLEEAWELSDRIAVLRGGGVPVRYAIVVDRTDDAFLARTRAARGLRVLDVATDGTSVRLDALLDDNPQSLTELLRAISANGVCVASVRPTEPLPADIFAGLIRERPDGE